MFFCQRKNKKKLEKTKRLSINGLHGKNSVPVTIEWPSMYDCLALSSAGIKVNLE